MTITDVITPEPALSMPVPEADRWAAWDRFLEATPTTGFMQSSWWADFRVGAGYDHFGAILKSRNTIVGGAVVLKFHWDDASCFYYIPDGPVLPDDELVAAEVFAAILDVINDHRRNDPNTVSHLRIEPRWERLPEFVHGFQPIPVLGDGYMEPRDTLCVDLRPNETDILAQMKPKGRYNIRVAQRHGVSVVEDNSKQGIADFLTIYKEMTVRQGLRAKPADYFEELASTLSAQKKGGVYFAEHQGMRIAAAVVVTFGRTATYFYGGSLDGQRHLMAPYLLHFEIMRRTKALGCAWYDFWGIAPHGTSNHPWQDISVFKRKFGGQEVNLVPTLDYVFDAAAYGRYVAAKGDPAMMAPANDIATESAAALDA